MGMARCFVFANVESINHFEYLRSSLLSSFHNHGGDYIMNLYPSFTQTVDIHLGSEEIMIA